MHVGTCSDFGWLKTKEEKRKILICISNVVVNTKLLAKSFEACSFDACGRIFTKFMTKKTTYETFFILSLSMGLNCVAHLQCTPSF